MEIQNKKNWSAAIRLLFKFIFIYVILFVLPLQLLYQDLIIWFGHQFVGVEGEVSTSASGSGDKLIHWLTFWFHLLIAFFGTVLWTVIDRNQKSYHYLAEGLYISVRYSLAFIMLAYGFSKVIPMQFSEPNLIRLTQEYGDSSPMGLAWTFMGFSTPYQMFAGLMELFGASLLFYRRTVLVGALVLTAVLTNVFLINLFFDVPVKLNSAHYLIFSVGLVSLHIKPLWNFFFTNQEVRMNVRPFPVKDSGWRTICFSIKGLLIGAVVFAQVFFTYNQYNSMSDPNETAGIYEVLEFRVNGDHVASNDSDAEQWRRLVIDNRSMGSRGRVAIDYRSGDRVLFTADFASNTDSISAMVPPNPRLHDQERLSLDGQMTQLSDSLFNLNAILGNDSLFISMKKIDHEELLLISRGFNWVNEFPFNR